MGQTIAIEERFWSKVRKKRTGCWEWQASTMNTGYGQIRFKGTMHLAHRVSWILTNGEIPKDKSYHGICVLHKCDNHLCVNPNHLFLGTNKDNVDDMHSKNRDNHVVKLNNKDASEIKSMYLSGQYSQRQIAKHYKIDQSMVSKIVTGKFWGVSNGQ